METREQATAAASREGLSVGDWLARNIIADTGFSVADGRLEESPVRRNGNETAASNQNRQRIDEALLSLARLLESHERAQEHANSAMQGVASEIEGAVRSQAGILQRLHQRVETVEGQSGGIAERGRQTAARLSALAHDLEALGNKIVSAREASDRRGLFVQEQLSAIAERMRAGEARVSNYPQVEQAVTKLSDSYVGAAARLQDLGAKFEKLTADLHAARDLSNRTMNSLQERLAGIDSRVRGTSRECEIESIAGRGHRRSRQRCRPAGYRSSGRGSHRDRSSVPQTGAAPPAALLRLMCARRGV